MAEPEKPASPAPDGSVPGVDPAAGAPREGTPPGGPPQEAAPQAAPATSEQPQVVSTAAEQHQAAPATPEQHQTAAPAAAPPPAEAPQVAPPPAAPPKAATAKPAAPAAPKPPAVMAAEPWDDELTRGLAQRFGNRIERFATYLGQNFLVAEAGALPELLECLLDEWEFDFLVDLTAVDYPARASRFELVYILYSFARNERVRVKCSIALGERASTVCSVHPTANWLEREVYDMFGIGFAGHPDLRRLLLPEDWQGFPLRRDVNILAMDNQWVKENLGIESGQ